jgi:hypothetical protein
MIAAIINPVRHLDPSPDRMTHKQALAFKSRYFDTINLGLSLTDAEIQSVITQIGVATRRRFVPVLLVVPLQQLPY